MAVWGAAKGRHLATRAVAAGHDRKGIRRLRAALDYKMPKGATRRRHPLAAQGSGLCRHGNPAHRRRRLARLQKWQNTGMHLQRRPPKTRQEQTDRRMERNEDRRQGSTDTIINNAKRSSMRTSRASRSTARSIPASSTHEQEGPHRFSELQQTRRVSQHLFEGCCNPLAAWHAVKPQAVGGLFTNRVPRCQYVFVLGSLPLIAQESGSPTYRSRPSITTSEVPPVGPRRRRRKRGKPASRS